MKGGFTYIMQNTHTHTYIYINQINIAIHKCIQRYSISNTFVKVDSIYSNQQMYKKCQTLSL